MSDPTGARQSDGSPPPHPPLPITPPQAGDPVPQPQGFFHANNAPNPAAYQAPLHRTVVKVGAPIGALIALGAVVVLWFGYFSLVSITDMVVGLVLATVSLGTVVVLYMLLDRWEPEPPRLLLFAFLWGAGLATAVAFVVNTGFAMIFGDGASAVVSAPFIEEIGKGSFLLLMLTGRRRKEMTSLTDCLIYAGMVAIGFAWLEDILYLINNPDSFGTVALLRLVFSPFAHPLFTSVTAIGVFYSMRQRTTGARVGLIIAGFLGAMLLHAAWNGSTMLAGGMGFLIGYVLIGVPLFAGAVVLAVMSRRRERQLVAKHLFGLAQDGIITWGQARSFDTLAHRKAARQQVEALVAGAQGAATALSAFKHLVDATTELAFVRDRFDRGLADQRMYQLHQDLAGACRQARVDAPVLDQITAPPAPVFPGPQSPYGQVRQAGRVEPPPPASWR